MGLAVIALIGRLRAANGEQRQQLKVFVYGGCPDGAGDAIIARLVT